MSIEMKELSNCNVEVYGGQIMSRITARPDSREESVGSIRVVIPKCINEDGSISASEMPEETVKIQPDAKRITSVGDIVLKLSTPYDAGLVEDDSAGAVVPSFCAVIKNSGDTISTSYLLACLNSSICKEQMKDATGGTVMSILSVGKIRNLVIPVPDTGVQEEIGKRFLDTREKLSLIKKIAALEAKRNNIVFLDLVKKHG